MLRRTVQYKKYSEDTGQAYLSYFSECAFKLVEYRKKVHISPVRISDSTKMERLRKVKFYEGNGGCGRGLSRGADNLINLPS